MLKAVTRQSAKVDAKIKRLNADLAATATAQDGDTNTIQKLQHPPPKNTITTAYFFDHYATPEDIAVMVTEEDFMEAHRELIPSVSAGELEHYEHVRASFEGGRGGGGGDVAAQAGGAPGLTTSATTTMSSGGGNKPNSTSTIKGKGKAAMVSSKGKGKAVATSDDDEEDEVRDEEDGYGNGYNVNGRRDKGKGKAVAEFRDSRASDDEGLYDE